MEKVKNLLRGPVPWQRVAWLTLALCLLSAQVALAKPLQMHIMEGFLPPIWCIVWFAVAIPFWIVGFIGIKKVVAANPQSRLLLGISTAFCFVLSSLKMPSVTGSCSHPCGNGLGTILFGPAEFSVLGGIVLVFQALLLAHGGLTTLGANTVSMCVVGPLAAWVIWKSCRNHLPLWATVFTAAVLADWLTYVTTAIQLAVAYPDTTSGVMGSFLKFAAIYAVTQVPLAISEGILTVLIMNGLRSNAAEELQALGVMEAA